MGYRRFAESCDVCGVWSEEYGYQEHCEECGEALCLACAAKGCCDEVPAKLRDHDPGDIGVDDGGPTLAETHARAWEEKRGMR